MNNNPHNIVIKFTPEQKEFLAKYQEEKQKKEQHCYKPMRTLHNY